MRGWSASRRKPCVATRRCFLRDPREACELLVEICRRQGVKKAIKSKSMLSERPA